MTHPPNEVHTQIFDEMNNPSSVSPPLIYFLYGSGGGGHKAAADALHSQLSQTHPDWHIQKHDISEIVHAGFGDSIYNQLMEWNMFGVMPLVYGMVRILQPIVSDQHVKLLKEFFYGLGQEQNVDERDVKQSNSIQSSETEDKSHANYYQDMMRKFWEFVNHEQQQKDEPQPQTKFTLNPEIVPTVPLRPIKKLPDLVISFVPFLNASLCIALPEHCIITVITDFESSLSHPWILHPGQILCCGTDKAFQQAQALGFEPDKRCFKLSGLLVHPRFYKGLGLDFALQPSQLADGDGQPEEVCADKRIVDPEVVQYLQSLRASESHRNQKPWLILFGGTAPTSQATEIFLELGLEQSKPVICVCGKNTTLVNNLQKLQQMHGSKLAQTLVLGFRLDIPELMNECDVVVGKPGPGVVSEAMLCKLPIMLHCPTYHHIMPQEKSVIRWVEENHVGLVFKHGSELSSISPKDIAGMRVSIETNIVPNRAVFELAHLVEQFVVDPPQRESQDVERVKLDFITRMIQKDPLSSYGSDEIRDSGGARPKKLINPRNDSGSSPKREKEKTLVEFIMEDSLVIGQLVDIGKKFISHVESGRVLWPGAIGDVERTELPQELLEKEQSQPENKSDGANHPQDFNPSHQTQLISSMSAIL